MSTTIYIYALCEPGTTLVRYIGKTNRKLERRLYEHMRPRQLKSNNHKSAWLKSLIDAGQEPSIMLLDITDSTSWESIEAFHIRSHREAEYNLTNATDGGEGAHGLIRGPEERRKRSETFKKRGYLPPSRKGQHHTEEWKRCKSENMKGKLAGEKNGFFGRTHSPETKAKMAAARERRKVQAMEQAGAELVKGVAIPADVHVVSCWEK